MNCPLHLVCWLFSVIFSNVAQRFHGLPKAVFLAKTFKRSSNCKFNNNFQIEAIIAAFGKPFVTSRFPFLHYICMDFQSPFLRYDKLKIQRVCRQFLLFLFFQYHANKDYFHNELLCQKLQILFV